MRVVDASQCIHVIMVPVHRLIDVMHALHSRAGGLAHSGGYAYRLVSGRVPHR